MEAEAGAQDARDSTWKHRQLFIRGAIDTFQNILNVVMALHSLVSPIFVQEESYRSNPSRKTHKRLTK